MFWLNLSITSEYDCGRAFFSITFSRRPLSSDKGSGSYTRTLSFEHCDIKWLGDTYEGGEKDISMAWEVLVSIFVPAPVWVAGRPETLKFTGNDQATLLPQRRYTSRDIAMVRMGLAAVGLPSILLCADLAVSVLGHFSCEPPSRLFLRVWSMMYHIPGRVMVIIYGSLKSNGYYILSR